MHRLPQAALAATALALAGQAAAQVTFYEGEGFRGRAFTSSRPVEDFGRKGFRESASSVIVDSGRWEVCEAIRFAGRCVVLRPGSYESLRALGLQKRIASVRATQRSPRSGAEAPIPKATAHYDFRRRPNERVFDAQVTLVRAVIGPPGQRCWTERQMVSDPRAGDRGTAGAASGTVLAGVLGHQVGGSTSRDAGSNIGRDGHPTSAGRKLNHCAKVAGGAPAYWDVTYSHQGVEHQVQMSEAPGRTISVNRSGEPRQ